MLMEELISEFASLKNLGEFLSLAASQFWLLTFCVLNRTLFVNMEKQKNTWNHLEQKKKKERNN